MKSKFIICLAVTLLGLFIAGCATQKYVDNRVQSLGDKLYIPNKLDVKSPIYVLREPSIDNNSDGKITKDEFHQSIEKGFSTYIEPVDINGDGKITSQEFIEYKKMGPVLVLYEGMDMNKDGKIIEGEFDTFNENIFSRLLKTYDTNHDSQISEKEFQQHYEDSFSQADTDKDGYISKPEKVLELDRKTRAMPDYMKREPIICGPSCVWIFSDSGIDTDVTERPVGYCASHPEAGWCPSDSYPGCTNDDVVTGNCVHIWPGYNQPFF